MIFCEDCRQIDIWRKEIFPNYKGTRTKDINVKTGFSIIKSTIQELIKDKNCKYYSHSKLEADDIVYLYRKHCLELDNNSTFIILASDIDYYQILYPNTKLQRLDKYDAMKHFTGNPTRDKKIKIIMGDKSDNIQAITTKCGKKTAEKYIDDPLLLEKLFEKDPNSLDLYKRNELIIDFDKIPDYLKNEMMERF